MATAAPTVKAALHSVIGTALAADSTMTEVHLTYGHPGTTRTPDMVAVMAVESEQEHGPMRTPPRGREETLTVHTVISVHRGGGPEVQQTVTERAFAILAVIETAVRADPTLGSVCRMAWVDYFEAVEADDPDILATGRVTEVYLTVRSQSRV